MDQMFPFLGHWTWLVAAGALLILELMAPGAFFVWLAIAAALVGAIDLWVDPPWQGELLLFAAFAVVSVLAGRMILKSRQRLDSDQPHLNQRMQGYIGKVAVLHEPITAGRGKVTIDDTVWDVSGPDAPKGARVKISGVDGLGLTVNVL